MRIRVEISRGGEPRRGTPHRRRRRVLLLTLAVGVVGALTGVGSYAAFVSTTSNAGNAFSSGSVAIEDDDDGTAILSLANAKPGDSATGCIEIKYTGTLDSTVRLYGSVGGALPQYLTLTITRGTDPSPSFNSCAGFTADATDYIGQGAGVVWRGPLSTFPATYAGALVDPTPGSPATWTTNAQQSFRFVVTLQDDNAAQGLTGTASFTWEARNQ